MIDWDYAEKIVYVNYSPRWARWCLFFNWGAIATSSWPQTPPSSWSWSRGCGWTWWRRYAC